MSLHSLTALLCSNCTLRCAYCYQRPGGSLVMPWPALRAGLDVLLSSPSSPLTVEFSGGEPLLAFPLVERAVRFVERVRGSRDVRYVLTTNGTALTADRLAFLDRHQFEIGFSFHALPGARDSRGAAAFRRLDSLLNHMRNAHHALWYNRLRVAITCNPAEVPRLATSVEYLANKGVRRIGVSAAFGETAWRAERIASIERQFARITTAMVAHRARTGELPLTLYRQTANAVANEDRRCSGARGEAIAIDPTGDAYGCVMLAGARPVLVGEGAEVRRSRSGVRSLASTARQAASALSLEADSPLWAFHLGDVRGAAFARRLAEYPAAVERSGIFAERRTHRSRVARCATCRYADTCSICPVARAFEPRACAGGRVPEFACAFTRVAGKYREKFPPRRTVWDVLESTQR